MNAAHFMTLYTTETRKLYRRLSSMIGLALCAAFGLIGPLGARLVNWGVVAPITEAKEANEAAGNPGDMGLTMDPTMLGADEAIAAAFGFRGFFFLPILIFIMAGLSFAAEHANRSIREYALRPVPRPALIMSRWLALTTWVFTAVLFTFVLSMGIGLILVGPMEEWNAALMQLGNALVVDWAFATLALSVAVFTRSIAATIAILILTFVLQLGLSMVLSILANESLQGVAVQMLPEQLTFVEKTFWIAEYLVVAQPPLLWGSCIPGSTEWQGYVTLFVVAFSALIGALIRFQRMDLP